MVINMNEAQLRAREQAQRVLTGLQDLEFRRPGNDEEHYVWIGALLQRFGYRDRCAQVTRLVSRWVSGKPMIKEIPSTRKSLCRRYTDVLVAEDAAHDGSLLQPIAKMNGPYGV